MYLPDWLYQSFCLSRVSGQHQSNPVAHTNRSVHISKEDRSEAYDGKFVLELQAKDKELQELQKELRELRKAHHALIQLSDNQAIELTSFTEQRVDEEKDLLVLQTSTDVLRQELQACKDDLFCLQPMLQTPDTEIIRQYDIVCQQVSNWIDEEIFQLEQKRTEDETHGMPLVLDVDHPGAMELLQRVPEAGEYMIASIIHAYLQEKVLGKHVYCFGLSEDLVRNLECIEQGMSKLEPRRDLKTIDNWRSETLKAIAEHPSFNKERTRVLQELTTDLLENLGSFFPIHPKSNTSSMRLYEQVFVPAAKLALEIQLSSTHYEFSPRMPSFPTLGYEAAVMDNLKYNTLIDVSTRRKLKPDNPVIARKDGKIGYPLLLLEPSLSRVDISTKRNLRKPVFLVELEEPLRKGDRGNVG
ncbi:MAG: hypothetical protein Q9187_006757 [Circinaria calcarea]